MGHRKSKTSYKLGVGEYKKFVDHKMHEVAKIIPQEAQTRETGQGLFVIETWELNPPKYNKLMGLSI